MTTIIFTEYPPCDLNGSHYATVYCPSCEESFCVDCSKLIHQRKKNRSHEPEEIQLQEPEPEEVPCDSDPSHIAVMYCEDCEENFCADCDYTFHSRKKTALHLRYEGARTPEVVEALKREAEAAAAEQARGTQTVTQTLQKTTINEAEDEEEEAEEGEEDEEEKEQQQEDHSDFNTESDDSDSDTSPASSAAPAAAVTAAAPAAARQASAGVQASTVASSSPASATKSVATPAPSVSASASYAAIAAAGKNPTTTSPQQPMTAKKPTASSASSSSSSSSATATSSASPTSSISSSSPTSHPVKLRKLCKVIAKEGHPSDELIASYKSAWNEMKARLCRKTYNVGHWLGLTTEDRKELAQTLCKELLFNPKPSPTRTIAWSATSFWTTYEIDVICEKTSVDAKSRTKLTTYKVHVDDHGRLENFELTTDGVADGGCNIM